MLQLPALVILEASRQIYLALATDDGQNMTVYI